MSGKRVKNGERGTVSGSRELTANHDRKRAAADLHPDASAGPDAVRGWQESCRGDPAYRSPLTAYRSLFTWFHDIADAAYRVDQLEGKTGVHLFPQTVDDHVDNIGAGIEVIVPGVLSDQGT